MKYYEYISTFVKFNAASLTDTEKRLFGLSKENFLTCAFNLNKCNITKELTWFYSMDFGNCFQFNSMPPLQRSILQGELNGLKLFIGPLVNLNQNNNLNAYSVKGLRLYIKEDNLVPTLLDECIFVNPGKQMKISMKRVLSHKQPMPHTNCEDLDSLEYESELVKYFKAASRVYRQQYWLSL